MIEGLRTEAVVYCTDCEASLSKFVILGYKNKLDVTWRLQLMTVGNSQVKHFQHYQKAAVHSSGCDV